MTDLLNDSSTYKKETKDPSKKIQTTVNNLINKWQKNNFIDKKLKFKLICHNGQTPYIYGLPKLHKTNIPLRPIVSTVCSATYKLSKFLSEILANVMGKNEHHIKDSWDFHNFIKNKKVPKNHILVSFDVVSLYTNIPIELAIKIITAKWNLIKNYTSLPKTEFIEATRVCLASTFFTFEEQIYSQIYGVAMGSPLSSTIANLVMEYVKTEVLTTLDFKPYFFKRFVDDCLLCIPENKIQYTLNKFNTFHQKLKFTQETEINKSINFLDLNICYNNEGNIKTKWYTKPTWSGRYLNFNSYSPMKYKKSVINSLVDRAVTLTDTHFRPQCLEKVRQTLIENEYPKSFFEPIIKNRINKIYNAKQHITNKTINNNFISLPFIPEITNKIKNVLKPFKINIAEKPGNNTKTIFTKLRPKITNLEKTNIVYKIDCADCTQTYIGQTKQYLKNRVNEHKRSIRKVGQNNNTALAKHALDLTHNFKFEEVQILDYEPNYRKRNIKEMIFIKKHKNSLNFRTDTENLSCIYNNLLTN